MLHIYGTKLSYQNLLSFLVVKKYTIVVLDIGLYGCKTRSRSPSMERTDRIIEGEVLNRIYSTDKRNVEEVVP